MPKPDELRGLEHARVTYLVERRIPEADAIHAPDFVIVTPSGHPWTKADHLGGIESGEILYRRTADGWRIRWSQATAVE